MLTSEKMQTAVCTVSVMHGLECGTDHELVRGKLKMFIKRKVRATGVKVSKRIDVSKLHKSEVREALRNTFDNIDVGGSWEQFKTQYT